MSVALGTACAGQTPGAGFRLEEVDRGRIDAAARRLVAEGRTPGLAVGLMCGGEVVYAKGFGLADVEAGKEVTPETAFLIGSITKHFTAAAVVLLAERGRLGLGDPVAKHLPGFPRGEDVTIRQLLTHTSGLRQVMGPGGALTPEQAASARSTDDMVALIAGLPDPYAGEPGEAFLYSNAGYWLLGAIVEKTSGDPLGVFFEEHLFAPAGMTATALEGGEGGAAAVAKGYVRAAGGGAFAEAGPDKVRVAGGAGGIRSTVGDMLRWQHALLSGKIVSPEGVTMMTTPAGPGDAGAPGPEDAPRPEDARGYGFGLGVGVQNGHAYVGHNGGSSRGFSANLKAFPDDETAFVVLTNAGPERGGAVDPEAAVPEAAGSGRRIRGPGRPGQTPPTPEDGGPRRIRRPGGQGAAAEIERLISEIVAGPPRPATRENP